MKQQGTVVSIQGRGGRQSPRGMAPGEFAGFIAAAATAILVALLTIFLMGLGARDALHWLLGPKW